jgi:hypothetical protein
VVRSLRNWIRTTVLASRISPLETLFLHLLDYPYLGLLAVELAGASLDRAVEAILQIDRQPVVIDFPLARLPGAVAPSLLEGDAAGPFDPNPSPIG